MANYLEKFHLLSVRVHQTHFTIRTLFILQISNVLVLTTRTQTIFLLSSSSLVNTVTRSPVDTVTGSLILAGSFAHTTYCNWVICAYCTLTGLPIDTITKPHIRNVDTVTGSPITIIKPPIRNVQAVSK